LFSHFYSSKLENEKAFNATTEKLQIVNKNTISKACCKIADELNSFAEDTP